jgi:lipopolysaccharide/colanic/teichoic acid biosynthesis glycosyltransferase
MYVRFIKRILDFFLSLIILPFLVPLILIIGPVIFFQDFGPVFYLSERIGYHGKIFKMIKFRTMVVNAPDIRLKDGSTYNGSDDVRVTKFGKFLRKSSLDEVPQFINVLIGEMSIIGPRPDPPDWLRFYTGGIKAILNVRPGITGYNQAYFRNDADGKEKMLNDKYYVDNISFLLDVNIFLKSIKTVILRSNVNVGENRE